MYTLLFTSSFVVALEDVHPEGTQKHFELDFKILFYMSHTQGK